MLSGFRTKKTGGLRVNNILLGNRVDYSIERVDTTGSWESRREIGIAEKRPCPRCQEGLARGPAPGRPKTGYRLTSNLETDMAERITRKQH